MRFIASGDLHMGTCPKGLPEELAKKYSGIANWQLLVRAAITERVDALLLLGDVVDWSNRFFEALGPLMEGIAELDKRNISVYAVAGNHDYEALESIARVSKLDNFYLLGRDGQWEARLLSFNGLRIQLFGWSFPSRFVTTNPFDSFPHEKIDNSCLRLGLLHADRDINGSRYAPVLSNDFIASGVEHWLLGHIHKPDTLSSHGAVYAGSPAGMDTTETGLHGPLLLDIGTQPPVYTRLPVSGLRYEMIDLELGEVANVGDVQTKLVEKSSDLAVQLGNEQPCLEDIVLTGRCRAVTHVSEKNLYDEGIRNLLNGYEPLTLAGGRKLWFMSIPLEVEPIEQEKMLRESGIIGQTARLIHELEGNADTPLSENTLKLLNRSRLRAKEIAARNVFRGISEESAESLEDTRALVLQQARRLLTELVARGGIRQ